MRLAVCVTGETQLAPGIGGFLRGSIVPTALKTLLLGSESLPPKLHGVQLVAAVWFVVWFAVGLVVLGFGIELPGGGWGDLVFNALGAALVALSLASWWPWRRVAGAFVAVVASTWWLEHLGATQGFLFGRYEYTDAFGPRLGGVVPLAVPLAWWTVAIGALQAAVVFTRRVTGDLRWLLVVLNAAGLAVLTDLPLETVAFHVRGYWRWLDGGPWYGVPVSNFGGWLLVASGLAAALLAVAGRDVLAKLERVGPWPSLVLVAMHLSFAAANLSAGFWLPGSLALANACWSGWAARVVSRASLTTG